MQQGEHLGFHFAGSPDLKAVGWSRGNRSAQDGQSPLAAINGWQGAWGSGKKADSKSQQL